MVFVFTGAKILSILWEYKKEIIIGILVLILIGFGYYFKKVLADNRAKDVKIQSLNEDITREKISVDRLSKSNDLLSADLKKYIDTTKVIQEKNSKLETKYNNLYANYIKYLKSIPQGEIKLGGLTDEGTKCNVTKNSILEPVVIIPFGVPKTDSLPTSTGTN
jgi:hypothetical protein